MFTLCRARASEDLSIGLFQSCRQLSTCKPIIYLRPWASHPLHNHHLTMVARPTISSARAVVYRRPTWVVYQYLRGELFIRLIFAFETHERSFTRNRSLGRIITRRSLWKPTSVTAPPRSKAIIAQKVQWQTPSQDPILSLLHLDRLLSTWISRLFGLIHLRRCLRKQSRIRNMHPIR